MQPEENMAALQLNGKESKPRGRKRKSTAKTECKPQEEQIEELDEKVSDFSLTHLYKVKQWKTKGEELKQSL